MPDARPDTPSHDDTTTTPPTTIPTSAPRPYSPLCPICWTPFTRARRRRYCSDNCRKTAWARRHATTALAPPIPLPGTRRDRTIYACPSCDTRYHGQQRCPDCGTFCTRVGPGGSCPHCDEPVALTDLLDPPDTTDPHHPTTVINS
jgi:hypothetical protein